MAEAPDHLDVSDKLCELRSLIEAIFLMANGLDRERANAFQRVASIAEEYVDAIQGMLGGEEEAPHA